MQSPAKQPATKPPSGPPVKLSTFVYECTNAQKKIVHGEMLAQNIVLAKTELRRQGLIPNKVTKKSVSILSLLSRKKVKAADISQFSRQLSTMLIAGIPLVQSLDIVGKGFDNPNVRSLILSIKAEVESGRPFSDALQQHPRQFDKLYCNLVSAGETSGALDTMLDRIATYKEKSESLKRKIKKALFYPTAVMVVAIVVTAILLIFVVPQFEKLFKGFGADLPLYTLMVLHISAIVQKWWWIILAIGIGGVMLIKEYYHRSLKMQEIVDKLALKIPVIGKILNKAAIARFARTLATTFAAGVPLVEALESVSHATGNIVYTTAVQKIKEDVTQGLQMNVAMRSTGVFSNMVIQMVAIGEEAGALDKMLAKIASIHEEEVDAAVDSLSSLLEPMIMAILGVVVGGLVIAMYLPIFKMGSVV